MSTARPSNVQTTLVFVGALIVAGGNGVAIRFSNRELAPLFGASIRFLIAALVFGVIMAASAKPWPRGRELAGAFLYGVLNFALAYGLIYEGLRSVHAGLAQVVLASVPLATILLAAAFRLEAFSWRRLLGTLIAVAGIAAISGVGTSGMPAFSLLGLLAILAAAVSIGGGAVVVKRFPPAPAAATNAIGMATGAVLLALVSLSTGERWAIPAHPATLAAIAFLIVSTIVLFAAFLFVIRRWSATATSYQFLLIVIPSVILSSMLDGEPLTGTLFVGGLLVMAGSYFAMRPHREKGHLPGAAIGTLAPGK